MPTNFTVVPVEDRGGDLREEDEEAADHSHEAFSGDTISKENSPFIGTDTDQGSYYDGKNMALFEVLLHFVEFKI
ncbi:solute carrier family 12 member 7-like [Arapaima gigas]